MHTRMRALPSLLSSFPNSPNIPKHILTSYPRPCVPRGCPPPSSRSVYINSTLAYVARLSSGLRRVCATFLLLSGDSRCWCERGRRPSSAREIRRCPRVLFTSAAGVTHQGTLLRLLRPEVTAPCTLKTSSLLFGVASARRKTTVAASAATTTGLLFGRAPRKKTLPASSSASFAREEATAASSSATPSREKEDPTSSVRHRRSFAPATQQPPSDRLRRSLRLQSPPPPSADVAAPPPALHAPSPAISRSRGGPPASSPTTPLPPREATAQSYTGRPIRLGRSRSHQEGRALSRRFNRRDSQPPPLPLSCAPRGAW